MTAKNRDYTAEEAAKLLMDSTRRRVDLLAKALARVRDLELKKAAIPPHKHNTGAMASGGIEDIPPDKINPQGIHKTDEVCKTCGKSHGLEKCGDIKALDKAGPPMAKPPSGVNMATHVPTSTGSTGPAKPGAGIQKQELDKAGLPATAGGQARQHALVDSSRSALAPAETPVRLPSGTEQKARADMFSQAASGAFQPAGDISSGLELDTKPKPPPGLKNPPASARPGIFGRLPGRR